MPPEAFQGTPLGESRRRGDLPVDAPTEFSDADLGAVIAHKLGPLAWHHLGAQAPPAAARRFAASHLVARQAAARNRGLLREVAQVVDVPFLVLKGLPVARWLYGDEALRPSVDVDILVAPRHRERVGRALLGAGFRATPPPHGLYAQTFAAEDDRQVDVHTEPWSAAIRAPELFARARWDMGLGARVPCERDQAALLAAHHVHDLGCQLLNALDVLLAVRRVGRVPEVEPLVRLIERDVARWLGIGASPPVEARWRPLDAFWRRTAPEARLAAPEGAVLDAYVAGALRPRRALAILARTLWPAVPSRRWRGRPVWRLARLLRFVWGR